MGDSHAQRRKISQESREAAIRELAQRQSGNLSRTQLLKLGLTAGGIDRRLRNGSLVTRYTGVYCLAPARQDPQALIAAAVLAGGPGAVASHASAAYLWAFLPHWQPPAEITITTGDRRPRHILTHRCPSLQPPDMTHQRDISTTSPARTALDIAPRLSAKQLSRLVNDGRLNGYLRLPALQNVLERNPFHPGSKLLKRFVEKPTQPTRSGFEDDFLPFIEKYGLPIPLINVRLNGREVDALFPDHRVIVELDGWDTHQDQDAFEDDRERDANNLDHGFSTIRITKRRLKTTPDHEAARLIRILSRATQ